MTGVELRPGESQQNLLKRFRIVPKSAQRRIAHHKTVRRERRCQWRAQRRRRR